MLRLPYLLGRVTPRELGEELQHGTLLLVRYSFIHFAEAYLRQDVRRVLER